MRLVCPNCEAKYEVPDDAIPDTGRDVQCASCGHAWYQMRPRSGAPEATVAPVVAPFAEPVSEEPLAEVLDTVDVAADEPVAVDTADEPEPEAGLAPEPEPEPQPQPDAEAVAVEDAAPVEVAAEDIVAEVEAAEVSADAEAALIDTPDVIDETVAVADAPQEMAAEVEAGTTTDLEPVSEVESELEAELQPAPEPEPVDDGKAAYAVDDSVLAILREEAERESSARRAEARPLEVQADLGIETVSVAPAVAAIMAEDKPSARRDLLPDVEEINSTLRPSETEAGGEADTDGLVAAQRRGGFRSGFLWVMTIAILGAGLYLAAPALSRNVPALASPLDTYVATINGLRLELDGLMRSATVALNGE